MVRGKLLGGDSRGDGLKYLGVGALNGITDGRGHPLCAAGNMQVLDGRARMFVKPFRGGRAMWQLTWPCDEAEAMSLYEASKEQLQVRAIELTRTWNQEFSSMVYDTPLRALRGGGMFDRPPRSLQRRIAASGSGAAGRVAITGDAAHPMSPFKGQGANQALVDALELGRCLRSAFAGGTTIAPTQLATVLADFHSRMEERVAPMVAGSRSNVDFYHHAPAKAGMLNCDPVWLATKFKGVGMSAGVGVTEDMQSPAEDATMDRPLPRSRKPRWSKLEMCAFIGAWIGLRPWLIAKFIGFARPCVPEDPRATVAMPFRAEHRYR
mmetsp:Transcript_52525/g.170629  ORF Transcript_52525/g.170629 Transcript_52525/m.170629 type:complete len:323 (-) Transcript_52525:423-1391(-)